MYSTECLSFYKKEMIVSLKRVIKQNEQYALALPQVPVWMMLFAAL